MVNKESYLDPFADQGGNQVMNTGRNTCSLRDPMMRILGCYKSQMHIIALIVY